MTGPLGTRYGADVTEWDGLTYSVTVDVPTDMARAEADRELPEIVSMTLTRLVSMTSHARAACDKRAAERQAEVDRQCPAVHAVRGDDDAVHATRCELDGGHTQHHRGGGIAWLSSIDPWAPDLAATSTFAPF